MRIIAGARTLPTSSSNPVPTSISLKPLLREKQKPFPQSSATIPHKQKAGRPTASLPCTSQHFSNQPAIASELVRRGADVAAVSMNPMEVTPLHSAAAARATEIVRMLLESGAPVNAKQHGGWTALHAAADNGDEEMIKILLQHGADLLAHNDDGRTPANIAELKGRDNALKLLSAA